MRLTRCPLVKGNAAAKQLASIPEVDVNCRHGCLASTPLMMAAVCGREDIAEMLLARADVDVNVRGAKGAAAIHFACGQKFESCFLDEPKEDLPEEERLEVMRLLLGAKDINVRHCSTCCVHLIMRQAISILIFNEILTQRTSLKGTK